MNVIKTMKGLLKTKKKTLSAFQKGHLEACIKYVQDLPNGFKEAAKVYNQTVKELRDGA